MVPGVGEYILPECCVALKQLTEALIQRLQCPLSGHLENRDSECIRPKWWRECVGVLGGDDAGYVVMAELSAEGQQLGVIPYLSIETIVKDYKSCRRLAVLDEPFLQLLERNEFGRGVLRVYKVLWNVIKVSATKLGLSEHYPPVECAALFVHDIFDEP